MKKLLALLLVGAMTFSLAACGGKKGGSESQAPDESGSQAESQDQTEVDPDADKPAAEVIPGRLDVNGYTDESAKLYDEILGEFNQYLTDAKASKNISERYALMAIAEAKLLEAGVMIPTSTRGGQYAISRVVPYTVSSTLWGNDSDRFATIVVCNELIKAEDRTYLRELWGEEKGSGEYTKKAKEYLEGKGYTFKDTYTLGYTSDNVTWDVLSTSRAADTENIVHTFDGLAEYDNENVLQPALAESWEVSEDGKTYTFHLRKGVKWVDSQGRELGEVKADDFVAGMQHMMDAAGGLEYLVCSQDGGGCGILNAEAYVNGEITDFSEVGVKAVDDYTLEYTLEDECSYFLTMLSYSIFAPMNRDYFVSQGGAFGEEYNPEADNYAYGKDPDHIAYCGPFLVTNATAESTIAYAPNPSYYNPDRVTIKGITMLYNDGTDVTKAYNDAKAGTLDGAGLNPSTITVCKEDGLFDDYAYISLTDATSFMAFINVNRYAFANVADTTTVISAKTVDDANRTKAALRNKTFRQALCMGGDLATYNAQVVGEDLKLNSLRNSYTPGNFVALEEDVTVKIGDADKTFPAGTFYGEIMQAQLDADGFPVKVWDPELLSSDGFSGWYNPEAAMEFMDKAVAELAEEGIVVDADHPIIIDIPNPVSVEQYNNRENALKQSIEATFGGLVVVNLTECVDIDQWYYAGYYTDYGYEANYDIYDCSGWGPDYGDPSTYLNTFLPNFSGYMTKCTGMF